MAKKEAKKKIKFNTGERVEVKSTNPDAPAPMELYPHLTFNADGWTATLYSKYVKARQTDGSLSVRKIEPAAPVAPQKPAAPAQKQEGDK